MAKHKKKIPALATVGLVVTAYGIYKTIQEKGIAYAAYAMGGPDPGTGKMDLKHTAEVWTPAAAGIAGSAIAAKTGANRYVNVPVLKL